MKIRLSLFAIIGSIMLLLPSQESYAERTYASHSVLRQGSWTKIRVKETGVCKLTYDQLKGMGYSDPKEVHVYGYGGALLNENFKQPKTDDLNETPIFDSGSAIYFYVQGPRVWKYRGANSKHMFDISTNTYSDYGYYFLTNNSAERKLIPMSATVSQDGNEEVITNFIDHIGHKKEETNLIHSGTGWVGDQTATGKSISLNFNFPNIDSYELGSAYLNLAAFSKTRSKCYVLVNDTEAEMEFAFCNDEMAATSAEKTIIWLPNGDNNKVTLKYISNGDIDHLWIDQVVVCAYRELKMSEDILFFRNPNTEYENVYKYEISNASKDIIVWNITNAEEVERIPTEFANNTLTFRRQPVQMEEFVAFSPNQGNFVKAELVGTIENQDLHAIKDIDFIIISHKDFLSQANRLAEMHQKHDNVNTLVVTPDEIYNEFSSGTPDASAIRWFLKMFYDRGERDKTILLFGDGCFDNRGILKNGNTTVNNYIITYQGGDKYIESDSYVSDDYFCYLDEQNDALSNDKRNMDYSIGRFPVSNIDQAKNMVDKVDKYLNDRQFGKWHNKVCLIADDNDGKTEVNKFFEYSDNIAKIMKSADSSMEIQKVHLDSYSRVVGSNGNRYPEVEEIINTNIKEGTLVFNYIGHSSELAWSGERIFTQTQAATIYNEKQGFWFTASCQFSKFDNLSSSGGEDLVLNPNGGALTIFSAARTVYDNKNDNLNRAYARNLFLRDENNMPLRIGEICRRAKNAVKNDSNKLSFMLLGDPMLRLSLPQGNVLTDSITDMNGNKITNIEALSVIKVYGHIEDEQSNFMNNFNGIVDITLYDKEVLMSTKGNTFKTEEEIEMGKHQYYDRNNILFSGQAEVENGNFSFIIKIPKDINYKIDAGRLAYYAVDTELNYDADGYSEKYTIGGSAEDSTIDNCGPEITMYLNNTAFLSGDKVNNTPTLYAEIEDVNGINSSGSGIGHDITLYITGQNKPIILNNNFSYNLDSYSDGIIKYQFPELEPGHYTATLKVWDLLNNSSQKTLEFVVEDKTFIRSYDIQITPIVNNGEVTFKVSHDMPNTVQSYKFSIINALGVILKETEISTGRIDQGLSWTWNLEDCNNRKVNNGVYMVKVEFETNDGETYGKTEKMVISQ